MKMRKASHKRATKETNIKVDLTLEGLGHGDIKTPIPFMSHMLDNFTRHGAFDLKIRAKGDVKLMITTHSKI